MHPLMEASDTDGLAGLLNLCILVLPPSPLAGAVTVSAVYSDFFLLDSH
jgi:hypothetical protein